MKKAVAEHLLVMLRKYGDSLSSAEVISDARRKASPLHGEFEWDKGRAHDIYLRDRAQALLREWYVQMQTGKEEVVRVRRLVSLPTQEEGDKTPKNRVASSRRYYTIESVLHSPTKTSLMLQEALLELQAFKRKYQALSTLSEVFAAIEKVSEQVEEAEEIAA